MAITIIKQPENVTVAVGATVVISVEAEGEGLSYQWQRQYAAGTAWENSTAGGAKTDTITFTAADYQSGYGYRCIITDASGNTVITDVARLTVITVGFIERSTMQGIADAIRAKTESTDKILPADMAGLIAAIETGGFEVMSGSVTPAANVHTLSLGTTLPKSDNYLFICTASIFTANSTYSISTGIYTHYIRGAVIISKDGVKSGETSRTLPESDATGLLSSIDTNFGILSGDSVFFSGFTDPMYQFRTNTTYRWWYAYVF